MPRDVWAFKKCRQQLIGDENMLSCKVGYIPRRLVSGVDDKKSWFAQVWEKIESYDALPPISGGWK